MRNLLVGHCLNRRSTLQLDEVPMFTITKPVRVLQVNFDELDTAQR